jgi:hypothetical protein
MAHDTATREKLYSLLGWLHVRNRRIASRLISQETRGSYVLEKLLLDINGIEEVPAYFR